MGGGVEGWGGSPGDIYRNKQKRKGSKQKDLGKFPLCVRGEIWKNIQIRYWRNSGDWEFGKILIEGSASNKHQDFQERNLWLGVKWSR